MKTTILRIFLAIVVCNFLSSCQEFASKDFVGEYQMDHPVLRSKINYDFEPVLSIKADNTFELQKDLHITGKWKFIGWENDKAKIQFTYLNKSIIAHFSGTIIYFTYPNDFDDGAFESMLFVKLNHLN